MRKWVLVLASWLPFPSIFNQLKYPSSFFPQKKKKNLLKFLNIWSNRTNCAQILQTFAYMQIVLSSIFHKTHPRSPKFSKTPDAPPRALPRNTYVTRMFIHEKSACGLDYPGNNPFSRTRLTKRGLGGGEGGSRGARVSRASTTPLSVVVIRLGSTRHRHLSADGRMARACPRVFAEICPRGH